jgi:two-component system catabolic regulation response regulator CreB
MTILIVEDEPTIADTVVYAVKSEGMAAHWVQNGRDAIAYAQKNAPDLIVLDVGLPDMQGFDVCRQIRAFSKVPIIFLTARDSEIDQVLGLELGADDYVTKPFSPRILTARIRSRLRAGQDAAAQPQAGFATDPEGKRIHLNGQDLNLTRYEYEILAILIKGSGRVYSRQQLMDAVWDEPDTSFDRTIDTHIKTIRQKIRSVDPSADPIETRRGLGYTYRPGSQ